MIAHTIKNTKPLDVSINIRREAGGFVSAYVHRLDGTLIVITPPCDTQDGAVSVAKEMYRCGRLAIPDTFTLQGNG